MKVSSDNAWELKEEVEELLGTEALLDALCKAMGTFELAENLAYICRMNDIESEFIEEES